MWWGKQNKTGLLMCDVPSKWLIPRIQRVEHRYFEQRSCMGVWWSSTLFWRPKSKKETCRPGLYFHLFQMVFLPCLHSSKMTSLEARFPKVHSFPHLRQEKEVCPELFLSQAFYTMTWDGTVHIRLHPGWLVQDVLGLWDNPAHF